MSEYKEPECPACGHNKNVVNGVCHGTHRIEGVPVIAGSLHDDDIMEKLADAFADPDCTMRRDRPYNGQAHTSSGMRGASQISGISFRDLRDCFVRAACLSMHHTNPAHYEEATKGENAKLNLDTLYELDWDKCDPVVVTQNLSCEIEKLMGIYPNVPPLT